MKQIKLRRPRKRSFVLLLGALLFATATTGFSEVMESMVPEVESTTSLLDIYGQGGWMMHVLLLCSVGTIAIATYCALKIRKSKMMPEPLIEKTLEQVRAKEVGAAYQTCQDQACSFSNVLSAGLARVNFERDQANKQSMDEAAAAALDMEENKHQFWVNYLNVFATLAPMLGLLGTVMGMMEAFGKLESGASEPQDLAGGINKAMGTTAFGLLVGIPAMFSYFFFKNKLAGISAELEKNVAFQLDVLSGNVNLEGSE